jgi:hypothetical protein
MRTSPNAESVHSAWPWKDDIARLVDEALRAANDLRRAHSEYAYRLAVLARAATGRRLSKGSAIEECARALGIRRQTLQPYSILTLRWKPEELRVLFGRPGANGRALSTSHLLLLARLPKSERDHWVERTLTEGLEVHELRARLRRSQEPELEPRADGADCG